MATIVQNYTTKVVWLDEKIKRAWVQKQVFPGSTAAVECPAPH